MTAADDIKNEIQNAWKILDQINDPEIPVLSIVDLGIVRNMTIEQSQQNISIDITPTYSGCPAMDAIAMNIRMAFLSYGYQNVTINHLLSPAWTTDWMTEKGKANLLKYGIAPPSAANQPSGLFEAPVPATCPRCFSNDTKIISEFGSTSCKALHQCNNCREPFEVFKCH